MAAIPPYEGAVFVPGTMDEVGIPLLQRADDPQSIVAYAGYGFWAPASVVKKVKGVDAMEITNGPIAPFTGPHVDDAEYQTIPTDASGQAVPGEIEATEPEANAAFPDQGVEDPQPNTVAGELAGVEPVPAPVEPAEPAPAENTAATDPEDATAPAPAADAEPAK